MSKGIMFGVFTQPGSAPAAWPWLDSRPLS